MKKKTIYSKVMLIALLVNVSILILLSTVFGCLFWNYSKTEKIESVMNRMDAVESACDILLEGVLEDMAYFSVGADLDHFNEALKDVTKAENIIAIRSMTQNMQKLINTNNHIFSIYLYIEENDWVLTSDGKVVKGDEFYDYNIIDFYNAKRKAGESTGTLVERTPRRQSYIGAEEREQHAVISLCSPLTAYTTKLNGLLIINLYESAVSDIINGEQANDERYVYLMNYDGEILIHTICGKEVNAASDEIGEKIINANEETGYFYDNVDGKKTLVSYKKLHTQNLICVGIQSFSTLINSLILMIILSFCAVLIVAGIGILIIFYKTKKVVAPMDRLIDKMVNKSEIKKTVEVDEVDVLTAAYDAFEQKVKQMETMLVRSKDVMQEQILLKMVTTQVDETDKAYISEIFPNECCTVLLANIDRYSEISVLHSKGQIKIIQEMILQNVISHLSKYDYISKGFWQDDGSIVIIVNFSTKNAEPFYRVVLDEYRQIVDMLIREHDLSISMAVGNIHSLPEIAAAYSEAQTAIHERIFLGSGSFIPYSTVEKKETTYYYPAKREKHLFNYLRSSLPDKMIECIEGMFLDIREKQNEVSYENVIWIFTQLAADIIKYIVESPMDTSNIFNSCDINNIHFVEKETLDNVEQWFKKVFLNIVAYQKGYKKNTENLTESTLSYIQANYTRDIDLARMSEHLGVSYSHIRKKFKEMTGETLGDYINKMRIATGKTLLAETNLTIYEIALKIGYNNDQSFSRFFKKYEGITPGQYRDQMREKESQADLS